MKQQYRDTQHKIQTEVIHKTKEYSNEEVVIKYVDEPYKANGFNFQTFQYTEFHCGYKATQG